MALLKAHIAEEMNRNFSLSQNGSYLSGSWAEPELFEKTAETFNATSTTFRFDGGATNKNIKRRGTTLTDNLTACVIRCPNKSGLIQVEFTQDGTGNRTIPTPTAVAANGTTAVTCQFIGGAFMTESTSASKTDTMTMVYDDKNLTLREIRRNIGY